jgi:hypothetical protein
MSTHPIDTTTLSLAIEAALQGAARRLAAHDHQMIARVATVAYVVANQREAEVQREAAEHGAAVAWSLVDVSSRRSA